MILVSFFQLNESTIFTWKNGSIDIFQAALAGIFAVQPEGRKFCRTMEQSRAWESQHSQRLEHHLLHFMLNCPSVLLWSVQTVNPRGKSQPGELCVTWGWFAGWVIPEGEGEHRNAVQRVGECTGMGMEQEGPFSPVECGAAALPCTAAQADLILCSCLESFGGDKHKNLCFINSRSWRCLNFPR